MFTHRQEMGLEEIELDQLKEKLRVRKTPVQEINLDTRRGSEIAKTYDILDSPALVLMREDGVAQAFWQTDLPTDNQLQSAYAYI